MFTPSEYQLLDFGDGRKLERFGPLVVDRPSPVAEGYRAEQEELWASADLRFQRTDAEKGRWSSPSGQATPDQEWHIRHGTLTLQLKPTPFGHLGLFPEQASNWDWLQQVLSRSRRQPRVLNLFAYTGGSTLAAAAAGAQVVHVDAAAGIVKWARRNAALSDLADAPIRWITEDARLFVERERKRGNFYDAVILDPPSYGHGPRGQVWRIQHDLADMLSLCADLTSQQRAAVLVSCHTSSIRPAELEALVADSFIGHCQGGVQTQGLMLQGDDGRCLPSGIACRWPTTF